MIKQKPASSLIRGNLDMVEGELVHGWILSAAEVVQPMLIVDDVPAELMGSSNPRPDVCAFFGMKSPENTGFAFRLPPCPPNATMSLYGMTESGPYLVQRKKLAYSPRSESYAAQMEKAAQIARQPGAVGIVCWDGAHNPVERARVLYNIASQGRPAILLCYLNEEFGKSVWAPLQGWTGNFIAIPWNERHAAHRMLDFYGINFETIWICKPRMPSFELASAVSRPGSRYILDIDDDEIAFSSDPCLPPTRYYAAGHSFAAFLTDMVKTRSVSGPALKKRFGGSIVRHAREPFRAAPPASGSCEIGFIGTARPHKKVATIARAIRLLECSLKKPLRFHIYGDVPQEEYRRELVDAGAIIHKGPNLNALPETVAAMNVLICGFPQNEIEGWECAARNSQVPAKISDALAAGRPILVPEGPAVEDLRDIPGIFMFNPDNFANRLLSALECRIRIKLPDNFRLADSYARFLELEKEASSCEYICQLTPRSPAGTAEPALLLFWKQTDAGIYGRRVDQIARSYRRKHPSHRVYVIEFTNNPQIIPDENENFFSEKSLRDSLLTKKLAGYHDGNIHYKAISDNKASSLRSFLAGENLTPANALVILFPLIGAYAEIATVLHPYRRIVDIVDNQLGWAEDKERGVDALRQYWEIICGAKHVIFNSEANKNFFLELGFMEDNKISVIPNWYTLPDGWKMESRSLPGAEKHLFYSGNMNDRIDWELMRKIAALENVKLHLAGTCERQRGELEKTIAAGAIYHGVLTEKETLRTLQFMDAAVIPHKLDKISFYMNPLKAGMYARFGIPIFISNFIEYFGPCFISYDSHDDCLRKIYDFSHKQAIKYDELNFEADYMEKYFNIIGKYMPWQVIA